MRSTLPALIEEIELKRVQMVRMAEQYGLRDERTMHVSCELDALLNAYASETSPLRLEQTGDLCLT